MAAFSWQYCYFSLPCSQVGTVKVFWWTQYTERLFTIECTTNDKTWSLFFSWGRCIKQSFGSGRITKSWWSSLETNCFFPLKGKVGLYYKLQSCFCRNIISALMFNFNSKPGNLHFKIGLLIFTFLALKIGKKWGLVDLLSTVPFQYPPGLHWFWLLSRATEMLCPPHSSLEINCIAATPIRVRQSCYLMEYFK